MFSPHTFLRALCALPHRGAATPAGAEAARLLQTQLADLGATVRMQAFETPKTYVTIVYWLLGGVLVGLALLPVTGVAVGFVWYFVAMAWFYFNGRYSFIIKFPVQHTAHNVIGHWPARTTADDVQTVILMAHYDTAPVSLLYKTGFRTRLILLLVLMLLAAMAATLEAVGIGLPYLTYLRYGLMAYFVLQATLGTLGYWLRGYSNGASDNATGVAAALATADRLRRANLPNLAIEVVLTSAKEAGMIGAYYYVDAQKKKWKRNRTTAIHFDTLGAGLLTIVEKAGTLEPLRYQNEPTRMARKLLKTDAFRDRSQTGNGHTADFDSVWFVRNSIPVLTLCALDARGRMSPVHQASDTLDGVEPAAMETAIDLAVAVVQHMMKDK